MSQRKKRQAGFTIVELMISIAIFSTILVLATVIMTSISNLFYKGASAAHVQDNARSIADDLASHLQLGGDPISSAPCSPNPASYPCTQSSQTVQAMCFGLTRYTYVVGMKLGSPLSHVLWRDQIATQGDCRQADLRQSDPTGTNGGSASVEGTELIGPNSRLVQLDISSPSPYTINIGIAYGDKDLSSAGSGNNVRCNGGIGDRFCSVSYLTTTVDKRVQ